MFPQPGRRLALTLSALAAALGLAAVTTIHPGWGPAGAGYPLAGAAAPAASASQLRAVPGTWDTGVAAQNLGGTPARMQVQYFNDRGELVSVEDGTADPGFAASFFQGGNRNLSVGRYAATVFADQPISVVVSEANYTAGMADFYNGTRAGAAQVSLPLVFRQATASAWNSLIAIQNVDDNPTTATVRFFRAGETAPAFERSVGIPASAAVSWDTSTDEFAPLGSFTGSAVITSPRPVAAIVNEVTGAGPGIMTTFRGVTGPDTRYQLPLLYRNFNGWNSGVQVQNLGPQPATVRATYIRSNAPGGPWQEEKAVPPGSSATFYLPASPGVPDGFVGSATLESVNGQPITALVNNINYASGTGSGYNAFGAAGTTPRISAPLIYKNYNGWSTGIQVQNLGPAPAPIRVTYYKQGGGTFADQQTAPPNASVTFYLPGKADLPDNFVGSALIESAAGVPIVAIVNSTNYGRGVSGAYSGENY